MQVIKLLETLGYNTVDKEYYKHIENWKSWYKGKVESFHSYEVFNGINIVRKEKSTLNMAKTICEDWANYIFNKDTVISTGKDATDLKLGEFMNRVHFNKNISEVVEVAFAMGTSAVTIIEENGEVFLNYIKDASMIYPLTWDSGEVIDVCFAGYKVLNNQKYMYLNIHKQVGDKWQIENLFFTLDKNGNVHKQIVLDEYESEFVSDVKRYAIFEPNIMNNIDSHCPMGLSVFANAIDALKGIDNVYDSYINEFVLGKKRIMVSTDFLQITRHMETIDGKTVEKKVPVFDNNDVLFYALPSDATGQQSIKEIDMNLRVAEHKEAMQDMLNMLSVKIGMGTKHYSFVGGTVTATEIKATTDTLYNAMIKHETGLEVFLKTIIESSMKLMGYDVTVSIEFDDSVIRDTNQDLVNMLQLLQNNIVSRADVLAWWKGCDIETARDMLKDIDKDNQLLQFEGMGV